jgi:hypothetical protein
MDEERYRIRTMVLDTAGSRMIGTNDDDTIFQIKQGCESRVGFCDKITLLFRKPVMPGLITPLDIYQDKIMCC